MQNKRLQYFDILKGIAIYMVVMGHVITFGIRDIDSSVFFKLVGHIHMPLFFFISGWFLSRRQQETGKIKPINIWKRFLQLIVPFVVVSALWQWYYSHSGLQSPVCFSYEGLWFNNMKYGYWFTPCLFELILVFAAIRPLFNRISNFWLQTLICLAVWVVLIFTSENIPDKYNGLFMVSNMVTYWPILMAGALASYHSEGFNKLAKTSAAVTICLIICALSTYVVCYYWEFPIMDSYPILKNVAVIFFHVTLAIIEIAVAKPWSEKAFAPTARKLTQNTAELWAYLGRKSLSIYLLHYFFLFPMGAIRPMLQSMNLDFAPVFAVAAVCAAMIIGIVLLIDAIIAKSPLLSMLLTGELKGILTKKQ